jgi:hypothetical protein
MLKFRLNRTVQLTEKQFDRIFVTIHLFQELHRSSPTYIYYNLMAYWEILIDVWVVFFWRGFIMKLPAIRDMGLVYVFIVFTGRSKLEHVAHPRTFKIHACGVKDYPMLLRDEVQPFLTFLAWLRNSFIFWRHYVCGTMLVMRFWHSFYTCLHESTISVDHNLACSSQICILLRKFGLATSVTSRAYLFWKL